MKGNSNQPALLNSGISLSLSPKAQPANTMHMSREETAKHLNVATRY